MKHHSHILALIIIAISSIHVQTMPLYNYCCSRSNSRRYPFNHLMTISSSPQMELAVNGLEDGIVSIGMHQPSICISSVLIECASPSREVDRN
ncbi:hypothetical protein F4804DRAFT_327447 [Jackrogersella minutella]|nr:hypothetical protein F4804DRAFT_327447 [Jackrogersella minutella]